MERMGILKDAPIKLNPEVHLPMICDKKTSAKKEDIPRKVLVINLPLDVDIKIHHHHWHVFIFFIVQWLLFLLVPSVILVLSVQHEIQVFQQQTQALEIQLSELYAQNLKLSADLERTLSETLSSTFRLEEIILNAKKTDSSEKKINKILRSKRDTKNGLNVENELNANLGENSTNKTKKGAVRAVHFKGLLPENLVEAGQIGPWYEDTQAMGDFKLSTCNLRDRGVKLIVNETGLYLIYAQVYYLTSKSLNSYSININPGNKAMSTPVAFCSASASANDKSASEVSCFTSVVRKLDSGDAISLQQQERQRRLVMRDGHSFVGLVRLG